MSSSHQADLGHTREVEERNGKRKWREIELIKERQRLAQELEAMDGCFDCSIEQLKT